MHICKKHFLLTFLTLVISLFLINSCKKNDNKTSIAGKLSGENVMQEAQNAVAPTQSQLNTDDNITNHEVDLDLTKMSATMIYSTVFDMLIMPEEYVGINIKVKGNFQAFVNEQTGDRYFSIIIPDATACCQQGIEFVWLGDHVYPDDYPVSGEEITIVGNYNVFENAEGITYTYLKVFSLTR